MSKAGDRNMDLLLALPFEITTQVVVHLHPYEVHRLQQLSRLHQTSCKFNSFSFALSNLSHARSSPTDPPLPDPKNLDWLHLGECYLAAHLCCIKQISEYTLPQFWEELDGYVKVKHQGFVVRALETLRDGGRMDAIAKDGGVELVGCVGCTWWFEVLLRDGILKSQALARCLLSTSLEGRLEIIQMILENPLSNSFFKGTIPIQAVLNAGVEGHFDVLNLLVSDPRTDLSDGSEFLLKQAVSYDNEDFIRFLLNHPSINPSA
ncbi:hypothetical protein HDU67_007358, partial [Dinochytrium kinnereticum]